MKDSRQRKWAIALGLVVGALHLSCNSGTPMIGEVSYQLLALEGCPEVEQSIRQAALAEMNDRLDQALENALEMGGDCLRYADGQSMAVPSASAGAGTAVGESSSGASQVSGTNNQVAGVDEADFVKNDNKYIFIVAGGALRIIEAWPAGQAKTIGKVEVEGTPKKLFVFEDRALVFSSIDPSAQESGSTVKERYYQGECTYGYSCSFTGDGKPTKISLFDISDRTSPRLVREIRLSGSYVNSRRVGAAVHTVISSPAVRFPDLKYWPADVPSCNHNLMSWELRSAFERLRQENTQLIEETAFEDWIPTISDTILAGDEPRTSSNLLGECSGFYRSGRNDGRMYTSLLSLDMTAESPVQTSTIVSRPGAVYASSEALYIAVPHDGAGNSRMGWYSGMEELSEVSSVHRFGLDNETPAARYSGSGLVKGRVLNQFSMDEWEGHLRIATTTGHLPSKDVHSTITVLWPGGGALSAVGDVDQLAPGEDIRSVRFDGERGFVVTFKKTDPLFVFDLSDPKHPRTMGELKIPGFSTYMHMMDEGHLLTIGYDADDQGSFAWFSGVLLQIFDVSDMQNPSLVHKEVIGTRGSSSEALTNHLAFTYFKPKDLLSLPMTVCEGGSGGGYGTEMTFSGLMVYDVTAAAGFSLRGKVPHPLGESATCSNWWTNASSQVKRSIIMDDYVFSISEELIKVNHLDNLNMDLVSIDLQQ